MRELGFAVGLPIRKPAVFLTEIMPEEVRISGFSLAYSLATAAFGGFTPSICTYLIHSTGNRAIPGVSLSFAAGCRLIAALILSQSAGGNPGVCNRIFAGIARYRSRQDGGGW